MESQRGPGLEPGDVIPTLVPTILLGRPQVRLLHNDWANADSL